MYIIFTIGRTGSSLLVHILNKFKDVTFSGEIFSGDLFSRINREDKRIPLGVFKVFTNKKYIINGRLSNSPIYLPKRTNYSKYLKRPHTFLNEFNKLETVKERLEFIMPLNKVVGCKILTKGRGVKDFLKLKNMKCFKIILLIREDVKACIKSMKRARFIKPDGDIPDICYENKEYKKIYDENKDRVYLLSYEDIVNRSDRFKGLFDFMNIKYNDRLVIDGSSIVCSYASSLI